MDFKGPRPAFRRSRNKPRQNWGVNRLSALVRLPFRHSASVRRGRDLNPPSPYGRQIYNVDASFIRSSRGGEIRTRGLLVPNQALYQAEPRPVVYPRFAISSARSKAASTTAGCALKDQWFLSKIRFPFE